MKKYCNKHYSFYETLQGCKDCGFIHVKDVPAPAPGKSFIFKTGVEACSFIINNKKAKLKLNQEYKVTRPKMNQEVILDLINMDAFENKAEAEELYKEWVAWENG